MPYSRWSTPHCPSPFSVMRLCLDVSWHVYHLAEVQNSQVQNAAWMRYAEVTPIFGSQKPFAVEGVTPISKVLQFEMSDGDPRLLVGTPTKSGDGFTFLPKDFSRPDDGRGDL